MTVPHVRPVRATDAEAIAALAATEEDLRQAAPRESHPLSPEVVLHWQTEHRAGYVLEIDEEVVAYGELNPDPDRKRHHWIGHVMVHPKHRDQGLGRMIVGSLLRYGMETLRAHQVHISAFGDNPGAVRCYVGCGFHPEGESEVDGRRLLHFRLENIWNERVLPRKTAGLLVAAAAGLTGILLPSGARFWLNDLGGGSPLIPLLLGCVISGALGILFQPNLPRRAAQGVERLLLPLAYGAAVGMTSGIATLFVMFILSYQGVLPGGPEVFEAIVSADRMGGGEAATWGRILVEVLLQSLSFGAGWGVILAVGINFGGRRFG